LLCLLSVRCTVSASTHTYVLSLHDALPISMPFWDDVFKEVSKEYPEVATASEHIDALSASFVTRPERYDVVVASNLFGDILSDRSEEHTSELQSRFDVVCRLLLEKKNSKHN